MINLPHLIIAGCPRSGTTALARLLGAQKDFMVTNEFGVYNDWNLKTKWKKFEKVRYSNQMKANESAFAVRGYVLDDVVQMIIDKRMSGKDVFKWIYENINVEFYGDKCPRSHLHNALKHAETFPNAKFIIITRDGRQIIDSQIRHHNNRPNTAPWNRYGTIEKAEWLWLECCRLTLNIFDTIPEERIFFFKYEDAVARPENFCSALSKFIHPEVNIVNNGFYKPINTDTWKENHPDIMDILSKEFKKYLERFGYI